MACMGPNFDSARERAKVAHEKAIQMLYEDFSIDVPPLHRSMYREDFIAANEKLKKALEDIFIADAADSF